MRSKLILPIVATLCSSAIFGQASDERTFTLVHVQTAGRLHDIAGTIRTTANIKETSTNDALKTIAARGTSDQISLAEWLVKEMDGPPLAARPCSPTGGRVYNLPGDTGSVGVFCFDQDISLGRFLAMIVQIRSVTKLQYTYSFDASRALVLRGSASQIAAAERLIEAWIHP